MRDAVVMGPGVMGPGVTGPGVTGPGGRRPQPQLSAQPLLRTTLGYLLRRARREQNRTLADVARAARVSLPYLSELERGRKEASSEILAAVCGALRLELSDLLAEAGRSLAADRARRALIEERARRRRERAGERPAGVGEPADGTAAVSGSGSDRSRGFPGTAPADAPVVVPLDAVRGRRAPGPGHGSGHAHARLAA